MRPVQTTHTPAAVWGGGLAKGKDIQKIPTNEVPRLTFSWAFSEACKTRTNHKGAPFGFLQDHL